MYIKNVLEKFSFNIYLSQLNPISHYWHLLYKKYNKFVPYVHIDLKN